MCRLMEGAGRIPLVVLVATGVVTAGCGNVTAGGMGEGEAVVSGNGGENGIGAFEERSPHPDAEPRLSMASDPEEGQTVPDIEGEVETRLEILLIPEGGGTQGLSGGVRSVTVDIRGESPEALGSVPLPEGSYSAVRIVFHQVEARVLGGLDVGGIPIEGIVEVDFEGASTLEVERPVSIVVVDGGSVTLTVHLRSAVWLNLLDPTTLLVPADAFTGAVQVQATVALP